MEPNPAMMRVTKNLVRRERLDGGDPRLRIHRIRRPDLQRAT
ncbi:hypothetical protein [Paraburkholderia ultramafica]|nr:hypothetical protein [Paraburkholderia ultramafica]